MDVVLVPGFMTDKWLWHSFIPELGSAGRTSSVDLSNGDSIEAYAAQGLAAASSPFLLLGFSMGGYVAREMARLAPDRVEGLVLVATSCRAEGPKQMAAPSGEAAFGGLSRRAVASSLHPDRAHDEVLVAGIRAMGVRLGPGVLARQSAIRRVDDRDRLAEIRCPTLVVVARQDRLRSITEAEELRDGIAGSTLVVIEGCGHMVPLEAPWELARVVQSWWATRRSATFT